MKGIISANKLETIDGKIKNFKDGTIWFDDNDKAIKGILNNQIDIIMNKKRSGKLINDKIKQFVFKNKLRYILENEDKVIIEHRKNTTELRVVFYDSDEQSSFNASYEILDENRIKVEFVEKVNGYIDVYFALGIED